MTTLPCGCCDPVDPGPPRRPSAPTGGDELTWRIRRHPEFLAAMTSAVSRAGVLRELKTREPDDPTIALLDAWAAVLDVLTFYTERIANEGFLRTATEDRSLAELAAMAGYRLQPGIAAETWLAFALETAAGAPAAVRIPNGTQVQSLPGPDEQPVVFETVVDLDARAEWSTMPARPDDGQRPAPGLTHCVVAGRPLLGPGDLLLVARSGAAQPPTKPGKDPGFALVSVEHTEPVAGGLAVHWSPPLPAGVGAGGAALGPDSGAVVVHLPTTARPFGHNAPDWRTLPTDVQARYGGGDPAGDWYRLTMDRVGLPGPSVARATKKALAASAPSGPPPHDPDVIHLDGDDVDVRAGDLVLLTAGGGQEGQLFTALDVRGTSLTDFTLTRPVTRIRLSGNRSAFTAAVRSTVAHLAGRPLPLAPFPRHEPYTGPRVPLAGPVRPVPDGRVMAATGRRARLRVTAAAGVTLTGDGGATVGVSAGDHLVVLAPPEPAAAGSPARRWRVRDGSGREGVVTAVPAALMWVAAAEDGPETAEILTADRLDSPASPTAPGIDEPGVVTTRELVVRDPLTQLYDPATLRFTANVARATHGEHTTEVLGDGDAAATFQRFTLAAPLTYLATDAGATGSLVVRVDGTVWRETSTLYGQRGDARRYALRQVEGRTVVQFGDGRTGARPPTGRQNITATYRTGSGRSGNVDAGRLSQLRTRPLGVTGVVNPVPAEGGDGPEVGARARRDAPLHVRTLDRVVSVVDHADFAAAYPGVGTATAAWVWDSSRRIVHVTCTGPDGAALPELTRTKVRAAIGAASDGLQPFVVAGHEPLPFVVAARLRLATGSDSEAAVAAATAALSNRYAAPAAVLARSVPSSSVIAALHAVPDVRGVDLLDFRLAGTPARAVADALTAAPARVTDDVLLPAQLLLLDHVEVVT